MKPISAFWRLALPFCCVSGSTVASAQTVQSVWWQQGGVYGGLTPTSGVEISTSQAVPYRSITLEAHAPAQSTTYPGFSGPFIQTDPRGWQGFSVLLEYPDTESPAQRPLTLKVAVSGGTEINQGFIPATSVIGSVTLHPGEKKRVLLDYRFITPGATPWPSHYLRTPLPVLLKDHNTEYLDSRDYYRHDFAQLSGTWASQTHWRWLVYRTQPPHIGFDEQEFSVYSADLHSFNYDFTGFVDRYGQPVGSPLLNWSTSTTPPADSNKVFTDQDLVSMHNADKTWLANNLTRPSSLDGTNTNYGQGIYGPIQSWSVVRNESNKAFLARRDSQGIPIAYYWIFGVTNVGVGYAGDEISPHSLANIKRPGLDMSSWIDTSDVTPLMRSNFGLNTTTESALALYEANLWRRFKVSSGLSENSTEILSQYFNSDLDAFWNSDNRDRLEHIGFNTVGYGSSSKVAEAFGTPNGLSKGRLFHVALTRANLEDSITNYHPVSVNNPGYGVKTFLDVFHPGYASAMASNLASRLHQYLGTPGNLEPWQHNFVGFFVGDIEKAWFAREKPVGIDLGSVQARWPLTTLMLTKKATIGPTPFTTKAILLEALILRQSGADYGTKFTNFKRSYGVHNGSVYVPITNQDEEELADSDIAPLNVSGSNRWSGDIEADLNFLTAFYANKYYETIKLSKPAGCLFLGDMNLVQFCPDSVITAASNHVDILSFNNYATRDETDWERFNNMLKPVLIGEFSFPGGDCVSPAGAQPFPTMESKGGEAQGKLAYDFLKKAAQTPNIIGAMWFRYIDPPILGRYSDGENTKVGLVDVTDQTRRKLALKLNQFSHELYTIRPFNEGPGTGRPHKSGGGVSIRSGAGKRLGPHR